MNTRQEILDKIKEVNNLIAKHRKLLNRAVGDKIIPVINYHHYYVVLLIGELKILEDSLPREPLMGIISGDDFLKALNSSLIDKEQHWFNTIIITGNKTYHKTYRT